MRDLRGQVTLIVNNAYIDSALASYDVRHEVTYKKVVTTLDGTERAFPGARRPIITFTLLPQSLANTADRDTAWMRYIYTALAQTYCEVTYTDPWLGKDVTTTMRVVSDLQATFGLKSINGNIYYKGGDIILRGAVPLNEL